MEMSHGQHPTVEQIRRELREYDLAHSKCPVDRRRAEKEAEARAQEAREVQEKQSAAQWWAALDARVGRIIETYCWGDHFGATVGMHALVRNVVAQALAEHRKEAEAEVKKQFEEERRNFEARIAELEARLKSVPGKLPVVKTWQPETVVYQAELVSHGGSLFQARKDTGQEPGRGADWVCVARRGADGKSPTFRGKFDTHERYEGFDIVTVDGCAFICRPRQSGRVSRHGLGSFDAGGKDRHPRRARRTGSRAA